MVTQDKQPQVPQTDARLQQYLDGQLPPRQARRLEEQMAGDETLREDFRAYASLQVHLEDLAGQIPPGMDLDSQRADIRAALERRMLAAGPRRRTRVLRPIFAALTAAAAAAAILVGVVLWRGLEQPADPGPEGLVDVRMNSQVQGPDGGPVELAVEVRRIDWTQVAISQATPADDAGLAELPSGTVLVSTGPPRTAAGAEGEFLPYLLEY